MRSEQRWGSSPTVPGCDRVGGRFVEASASGWPKEKTMILSTNQELGEYDQVATPDHVAKVWSAIERRLPDYWEKLVSRHRRADNLALFAQKFGGSTPSARGEAQAIAAAFEPHVAAYEKDAARYRAFLDADAME